MLEMVLFSLNLQALSNTGESVDTTKQQSQKIDHNMA